MIPRTLAISLVTLATVAACGQPPAPDAPAPRTTTAPAAPPPAAAAPTPTIAAAPPAATPSAPPAAPVSLATQPGIGGSQVDLVKLAVTGNLLTAHFTVRSNKVSSGVAHIPDIAVIDDATSQRYSVVKDSTGNYMASPLVGAPAGKPSEDISLSAYEDHPTQVSIKFPAPPPETKTVSIAIPGVGPFDGIAIQR